MKKMNFNKALNYFGVIILFVCLIYLLFQRFDLYSRLKFNQNGLEMCKDQVKYQQKEIEIRSKAIGSELDFRQMKLENLINYRTNTKKILIFADAGTCQPCFHEIVEQLFEQKEKMNVYNLEIILVVGSRNEKYTQLKFKQYFMNIPVFSDTNFVLNKKYNLNNSFTTCFLLDEHDKCISLWLFRKGDDYYNKLKGKVMINTALLF